MRISHRFFAHASATLLSHASRLVAGIFLPPFVLSRIGKEGYGLTVMVTSTLTFVALLQLGVPQATVRYLSERLSHSDNTSAQKVYSSAVTLMSAIGVITALVILWIAYHPELLGQTSVELSPAVVRSTVLILGAAAILSMPMMISESSIIACRQFLVYAGIQTSTTMFRVTAVFVSLSLVADKLFAYVIITALSTVLTYSAAMYWQKMRYPLLQFSVAAVDRDMISSLIKHGSTVSLSVVAWLFMSNINMLVIGRYLGAKQLTFFSLALVWSGLLQGVSTSISQVLLSDAAGRSAQGDLEYLKKLSLQSSKFIFVGVTPVILFLIFFRQELIVTWLGPGFEDTATIMLPILLGELFTVVNSPVANITIVTGMAGSAAKWNVLLAGVSTAVLFLGTMAGGWGLGEVSILYGAVFAVRGGIIYPLLFSSQLKMPLSEFYRNLYLRPVLTFILTGAILMSFSGNIGTGWGVMFGVAVLTGMLGWALGYLISLEVYDRQIINSLFRTGKKNNP